MLEIPEALSSTTHGTLECLDRIVLTITPQGIEYPKAYINHLRSIGVDPCCHTEWASNLRDQLDSFLKAVSIGNNIEILNANYISRKDDKVKAILENNGYKYGLITIIKSMERCKTYYYAKTKTVRGLPLYFKSNKCIYYYVYIYDKNLGIVQIRVQTYAPFYCQIILNGHRILEQLFKHNGISNITRDNSFTEISDVSRAQELADSINSKMIEELTEPLIHKYFPFYKDINLPLRYTIRQVEFSTDFIAKSDKPYSIFMTDIIGRLALFNPPDIARFMVKIPGAKRKTSFRSYVTEFGSCIRFSAGDSSVKMYDKGEYIFRIETTFNNISKLKGLRTVTHNNGEKSVKIDYLSKHISSLETVVDIARHTNHRFIERIGIILSNTYDIKKLDAISINSYNNGKSIRGFSFFNPKDRDAMLAVANPATDIHGITRKALIAQTKGLSPSQASYILKRLKCHHLIKLIPGTRKYHLTKEGRKTITTMNILTSEVIKPSMCA